MSKTITLPEGAIVGRITKVASIGDIIEKTGKARKQNVYEADFGQVAMTGSLYGKLDGVQYDIILVPVVAKK